MVDSYIREVVMTMEEQMNMTIKHTDMTMMS